MDASRQRRKLPNSIKAFAGTSAEWHSFPHLILWQISNGILVELPMSNLESLLGPGNGMCPRVIISHHCWRRGRFARLRANRSARLISIGTKDDVCLVN